MVCQDYLFSGDLIKNQNAQIGNWCCARPDPRQTRGFCELLSTVAMSSTGERHPCAQGVGAPLNSTGRNLCGRTIGIDFALSQGGVPLRLSTVSRVLLLQAWSLVGTKQSHDKMVEGLSYLSFRILSREDAVLARG